MNTKNTIKPTIIIEPNQRGKQNWIRTWIVLIKNVIDSKDLIFQLFKRDFLMANKRSFLGMSWLILTPIMGIISWVLMNSTGVLKPGNVGIPYPAYVLLSTSIYGLFLSFFTGASLTLSAGTGFILQVSFAHDVLLVKQLLHQMANFMITFVLTIIVLLFFGVVPSWQIILFPILIIPLMLLGSAIGLFTTIISVVATDIQKAITFFIGLLMYVTPVIYSSKVENVLLQKIIKWNPLTYLIGAVRDSMIYGKIEHLDRFFIASALSLVIFLIAWRFFYVSEQKVIEKMI
ncbi:MAG: ABC transporter permease [Bacteroidetes bacterium]|nr:ABC transporter permease [Bacteroidota bacterium]